MNDTSAGCVFISYSHVDRDIVGAAVRLLRAGGATVFMDVDIPVGELWEKMLLDVLAKCERVMVFWSGAAAASEWVGREWACALDAKKRVVPMLLDKTPLPPRLAQFQGVPDLLDMLRAAMRLAPDAVAAAAPMPAGAKGKLWFVASAGVALATLAIGLWFGVGIGDRGAVPGSRGPAPPGSTGPTANVPSSSGWALLVLLLALLALALLYSRKKRRAAGERGIDAIGRRFTSALFDGADAAGEPR